MSQGAFSYGDTQHRLGVNHGLLPSTPCAACLHHGAHCDAAMRRISNGGAAPNYQLLKRFGTQQPSEQHEPARKLEGPSCNAMIFDYDRTTASQGFFRV